MGEFFRKVFGGSKSQTVSQSTSTPIDMIPGEFAGLRGDFASVLSSLLKEGPEKYTGPLNAPIGGNEQNLLDQLMGQTGAGTSRAGLLEDTIGGKYLNSNPHLDEAIKAAQRPTLQGLEETLSRALPGRFTQAGHMIQSNVNDQGGSSAFDRAASIATRATADAVSDIATKMSFGNYEAERGRQQDAIPLQRAEVDATISNLQAQALPRLIQELGIERGLAEFQRRTTMILEILKTLGAVTAPTIANQQQASAKGESTVDRGAFPALFPKGLGGGG